jgi:hypothetical protein
MLFVMCRPYGSCGGHNEQTNLLQKSKENASFFKSKKKENASWHKHTRWAHDA